MKKSVSVLLAMVMVITIMAGCGRSEELKIDVREVFDALVSAQTSEAKVQMSFFEESIETAVNYYPEIEDHEYKQTLFQFATVTGSSCEVVIVEVAKAGEVDAVKEMFKARIKDAADNVGYADIAKNWQKYAQVQSKGNYVAMICLPGECVVPEDIFDIDSYKVDDTASIPETEAKKQSEVKDVTETDLDSESENEEVNADEQDAGTGGEALDMTGHEKYSEFVDGLESGTAVAFIECFDKEFLVVSTSAVLNDEGKLVAPSCEVFGDGGNGKIVSYGKIGEDDSPYMIKSEWQFILVRSEGYYEKFEIDGESPELKTFVKYQLLDNGHYYFVCPEDGIDDEMDDSFDVNSDDEIYDITPTLYFYKKV